MVSQACYATNDGRRYSSSVFPPYLAYPDRRFHLASHDSRAIAMTDPPTNEDPTPPRKRIAVACGRCRKRKIRCSGDPGHGLSCSNCKNAGFEPCLFLRVQSTPTEIRNDHSDYAYPTHDARAYAHVHRTEHPNVGHYAPELPALSGAVGDVVYRGYPYGTGASKGYYTPATTLPSSYGGGSSPYADEYVDYNISCSSQPMLHHDPSSMMTYPHGAWSSGPRKHSTAGMYVEPDPTYSYVGTATSSLVHRPAPSAGAATAAASATGDSPNFSFASMSTSLPAGDRLLPTPTVSRALSAPGLAYPSSSVSSSTLAMKAIAASSPPGHSPTSPLVGYGSFDPSGLPYPSASSTLPSQNGSTSSRHSSQSHASTSLSGGSHGYATTAAAAAAAAASSSSVAAVAGPTESMYHNDVHHSLRTQGSVADLVGTYTYDPMPLDRGSSGTDSAPPGHSSSASNAGVGGGGGGLANGQTYVPSENSHHTTHSNGPNGHAHGHAIHHHGGVAAAPHSAYGEVVHAGGPSAPSLGVTTGHR